MTKQYDLMTTGQIDIDGRTHVVLRGRDINRKVKTHIVPVTSYFYAGIAPEDVLDFRAEGHQIHFDVLGRPTIRIKERLSSEVGRKRKYYPYTCEANINVTDRYCVDKDIYTSYIIEDKKIKGTGQFTQLGVPPKIMYFDIETSVHPDYKLDDGEWPIVSIQSCTNYNWDTHVHIIDPYDKYPDTHTFVLSDDEFGTATKIRIGLQDIDEFIVVAKVHKYKTEKKLLKGWIRFLRSADQDPDYLGGWYSNYFDIPEIIKALRRNNIDWRWLSPLFKKDKTYDTAYRGLVALAKKKDEKSKYMQMETPKILGRECIDMLDMYKKLNITSERIISSWDLKDCVRDETLFSYKDIAEDFRDYHLNKPLEALDYCVKDAIVLKMMDMAIDLTGHFQTYRELFGIRINDSLKFSLAYKILLLRITTSPIPTRSTSKKKEKQKGAKVIKPAKSGVIRWTCYLDFKALYPYLMRVTNAGLETFLERTDRIAKFRKDVTALMVRAMDVPADYREVLREKSKEYDLNKPYEHFLYEKIKRKEKSVKSAANSGYGASGYYNFPMYSWEANQKVTFEGREIIAWLISTLEEAGFDVVYGDTDGVMVDLEIMVDEYEDELDGYIKSGKILEDFVNWKVKGYTTERGWDTSPEIKLETISETVIFQFRRKDHVMAKKKYVKHVVYREGFRVNELEKKGVQSKRSDTAEITRRLMDKFFHVLLVEQDTPKALELIRKEYNKVASAEVTQREIAVPHGLRTAGEQYWVRKAVKYAEDELGETWNPNMKPRILYIDKIIGHPKTAHLAIVNDDIYDEDVVKIDYKTTAEKIILNKLDGFLRSLGMSAEALLKGQTQLERFW